MQRPDGTLILDDSNVLDRQGNVRGKPRLPVGLVGWSDDSSGFCVLAETAVAGVRSVQFITIGGARRQLTQLSSKLGVNIAACSPTSGAMVIVTATGFKDPNTMIHHTRFGDLIAIDLQTGAELLKRPFSSRVDAVDVVAVSHDGRLLVEGSWNPTVVTDLSSGKVIARLTAMTPLAFSWDGTLLAAVDSSGAAELIELSTQRTLWRDTNIWENPQWAAAQPGGNEVAFAIEMPPQSLHKLVAVGPSGQPFTIATNVFVRDFTLCGWCSTV